VSPECPPGYGCIDGECQFDPCGGTCPPEKTCATHNSESACVAKPWALLTIGRPAGNGNYHRLFEEWLRDLPGNTSFSDRPHLECSAATDGFDDGLMISFADGAGKWEGLVGILPWTSDQTSWPVKYYITTTSGIGEVVDGRYLYDRGTTQLSPGYDCTASTDALTGGPEGWGLSFYVKCNAVRFGGTEELFFSLNGACTDFKRP
jgi:hypothetical protein